jgi:GNAT superfamily N-acetyltransferase
MSVTIEEGTPGDLERYAAVSPAFLVESVLQVEAVDGGVQGIALREEPVVEPYTKDYDASEDGPRSWPAKAGAGGLGIFIAQRDREAVGGAIVALTTPEVAPLAWPDSATLCDIRVRSDLRGQGVGGRLLDSAVEWARERGAHSLLIETQNVNVPACRFYASRGAELAAIDRFAYAASADARVAAEVMLVWRLAL